MIANRIDIAPHDVFKHAFQRVDIRRRLDATGIDSLKGDPIDDAVLRALEFKVIQPAAALRRRRARTDGI